MLTLPEPGQAQVGPPLDADEAFALSVDRTSSAALRLNWQIADGYYLYRDRIELTSENGEQVVIDAPPGKPKDDPYFGRLEIYHGSVTATVSEETLKAASGSLTLTYQGCQEDGICYRPQSKRLDLDNLDSPSSDGVGLAAAPRSGEGRGVPDIWQRPDAKESAATMPGSAVASSSAKSAQSASPSSDVDLDESAGLIDGLLRDGGSLWVIAAFFALGLGLAFTPCVLPMYPILAGQLARNGEELSASRGFVLSASYVFAMALAFGLLGVAAAWSGQNLQMVLQSNVAIIAVAAMFFALAMSMFGLFELRLPATWSNRVAALPVGRGSGVVSSAGLGFTSALIVGPCVTAPLAGGLLYIAKTGDLGLGGASLFALGFGQGVPLIGLGTLGAGALPKPGPWMAYVTRGFGFVFLALAVWMLSRILPAAASLFLWSVLLIGTGVFVGAFDQLAHQMTPLRRLAQSAGIIAVLYGAILGIGAGAGGTDPLHPLGHLAAAQHGPGKTPDFRALENASDLAGHLGESEEPTLIYVTADWCAACQTIKRHVFADAEVNERMAGLQLLKIDVTDMDSERAALIRELGVAGPPTMLFLNREGQEPFGTRLIGEVSPRQFVEAALRVAPPKRTPH
ncbi:protein-disulfide reductase DsbD [Methyloligella halotolerans]|uniref:protein-disulfide reductase DsbD n=1 Tax=Methyloligella halotolerans TaxID=1177755 RepID=UPI0014712202|nr:protein-disulfide reductase DsbD [Methyloligella halotolerans]